MFHGSLQGQANTTAAPPRRRLSPSGAKFEQMFRAILPIVFTVFCAAFAAAIMASGEGEAEGAGSVPGHTASPMRVKVLSIKG